MLVFDLALIFIALLNKILSELTFVLLSFELFLFIFQSVVFSRDIIKAKVGFLFRARVSFVEEALGTNLLKSRLFYLGGQFILAHWKIEKKNNKKSLTFFPCFLLRKTFLSQY